MAEMPAVLANEAPWLDVRFEATKPAHGGVRKLPWAFTEHGAILRQMPPFEARAQAI